MKGKEKNYQKGITLIALVITIVVLLILAGITLSIVFNGGIIDKSQNAVDRYTLAQKNEIFQLNAVENLMNSLNFEKELDILDLAYEIKQNNQLYTAETNGIVCIESYVNPSHSNIYIYVYDENDNYLYGDYFYINKAADGRKTLFVPKGCKWKAYSDGAIVEVKWFDINVNNNLNLEYEIKENNKFYVSDNNGIVYIESASAPINCEIDVYDENDNVVYGVYTYVHNIANDSKKILFVPKGCKWKAYSNGGIVNVRWFEFK